jgi:hypothetical protein
MRPLSSDGISYFLFHSHFLLAPVHLYLTSKFKLSDMAPKADPRLKKTPAPASSAFLGGARKKEVGPRTGPAAGAQAANPEVRREKRQLSQSAEKVASISKKTKEEAVYDPKALAVPLLSSFRDRREGSPSNSSVTTLEADPEPGSDTDVEAAAENILIGEATSQLQQLGRSEVCFKPINTQNF